MTIEKETKSTILQQGIELEIGGKKIIAPATTVATLITASAYISELPSTDFDFDSENWFNEALFVAKDCEPVIDIVTTFIVGGEYKPKFIWRYKYKRTRHKVANRMSIDELHTNITKLLGGSDVARFFGTIISLNGANLLKPTKKIDQIASGQP